MQTYKGLEKPVADMLRCGIKFEKLLGRYYESLSKSYPEHRDRLMRIAKDSYRHASIYSKLLKNAQQRFELEKGDRCVGMGEYLGYIEEKAKAGCEGKALKECLLPQEEIYMYVYAQMVLEVCVYISSKLSEDVKRIIDDEMVHEKLVREIE